MQPCYPDIVALTKSPPLWFDDNGVPRYAPFEPRLLPNIYVNEAALLLVACQECGVRFHVSQCLRQRRDEEQGTLAEAIRARNVGFEDPPGHGHHEQCCAGPTMTSIPLRVMEYWCRTGRKNWVRDSSLEIEVLLENYGDWPIRKDLLEQTE